MTSIRRLLVLLALTVAVIIGASVPAFATFKDSVAISTAITTTTVAPVTNLVGNLNCAPTSTMSATWTRSTTPRVSGYQVKVYFSDGFVQTVELGPTAASWSVGIAQYYVTAFSVRYSVTTRTDYGWTTESVKTGAFQC